MNNNRLYRLKFGCKVTTKNWNTQIFLQKNTQNVIFFKFT